jgi:uncharacterized protein YndB with AHSA1/START domain
MKWLKWLAGPVIALLIGFLAVGLFVPKVTIVSRVQVAAAPEAAWSVFMDPTLAPQWLTYLESLETVSGAPETAGSVNRLTFLENGRRIVIDETVTAIEPARRFAFDSTGEWMAGTAEVVFTPAGTGTVIECRSELRGRGPLWRSVFALSRTEIQRRQDEQFAKLAALIDAR